MNKLSEKVKMKIGIIILIVIALGLVTVTTLVLSNTSNANRVDISPAKGNASVDTQISGESKMVQKVEVQPIVMASQTVVQPDFAKETAQAPESEQTIVSVKSIQEGQPQAVTKPTPPPKPQPQGELTDKAVYIEDVKPQQSQPKMGDKNDKGEVYIEGFGWIKDEGSGGKGTTVGKPGDQLIGNKVGTMN